MQRKHGAAVFVDRDGVLNRVTMLDGLPVGPLVLADFALFDDVGDAVRRLKKDGYKVIVATNQPEIARGRLSYDILEAMHRELRTHVPVDAIYVCPHDDRDHCACRKPKPGLLHAAAKEFGIDLAQSYMVGDRWRDVEAGKTAGCCTYLIDRGYSKSVVTSPDRVVASLAEAANDILKRGRVR